MTRRCGKSSANLEIISSSTRAANFSSTARLYRRKFMSMLKSWHAHARSVHGFEYHTGPGRFALSHVRGKPRSIPKSGAAAASAWFFHPIHREIGSGGEGKSARQHGYEHQYRGSGGRT